MAWPRTGSSGVSAVAGRAGAFAGVAAVIGGIALWMAGYAAHVRKAAPGGGS